MGNVSGAGPRRVHSDPAAGAPPEMRGAGPGWYFDPEDQAIYRFWDGERWTEHRSDLAVSGAPSG